MKIKELKEQEENNILENKLNKMKKELKSQKNHSIKNL